MANPDADELADALRRDPRAWTWSALESRWSRSAINGALLRGTIAKVLPGIYASAHHAESFLVRAHAAHLWAGGNAVLIGAGAAAVWGFCDFPGALTLRVPPGFARRTAPAWLKVRRSEAVPDLSYWGVCPVAVPAWAAVTAYAEMPSRSRDAVLYRASQSRDVKPEDLNEVAAALPRLKGREHFRSVLSAIEAGSESHLETLGLRTIFNTAAFADLIRQHRVRTPGGSYRLDMSHPASLTAIELDGGDHEKPTKRQDDITRDANVARIGILTLRFSGTDARTRAAWVRATTAAVIESRS